MSKNVDAVKTMDEFLFPTVFIVIVTALAVLVELIRTIFEI